MFDAVDRRLMDWVARVAPEAPVSLGAPERDTVNQGVGLYLLELAAAPPARTHPRPPLQLALCYLVTVGAETPERAHHLLGQLVFSAMEEEDLEVDLTPVSVALWQALGVPPRPGFRLRVRFRQERPAPALPRVRATLVARATPPVPLLGQVLGPANIPLPRARVELPALGLSTQTDGQGRFHFPAVPSGVPVGRLEIHARGEVLMVRPERLPVRDGMLQVRLPLKEG